MIRQLRLLRYIWPHWRGLVTLFVTMALTIGLEVLHPWPTKLLVDQVLGQQPVPPQLNRLLELLPGPHGSTGLLLWVCVGTVKLYLATTLVSMIYTYASIGFGQKITFDLGADLFLHLQRLSLLFHSRHEVGDMISRVTGDTYCLEDMVNSALLPQLQSVITLVTMFVILWHLEPKMTVLSLGVVPFLILVTRIYAKPLKDRSRERRDLEGHMMSVVEQALGAIPAVQAFTREEMEYARFRNYAAKTVTAYQRSTSAKSWFNLSVGLITSTGTALIMYLGARYVLESRITVGTILVFLSYLGALYDPLDTIISTASTWQYVSALTDRVTEILDIPAAVRDARDSVEVRLQGHVVYEGVTFGYEQDRPVLHKISFETQPGDLVAIVGPTGAGKTTLVSLLLRFFDPWSGRVIIDGQEIRRLRVRSLRQQVAIVLQDPFIFPISVAENIAYGRPEATRDEIVAAAVAASADDFIQRLPEGYDTVIGEKGATLSGGEKQRLSIARAFLKDAPILILDEPTSALDARTESLLLGALDRLMKGRTTFIIAHRLSTIRNVGRILVIEKGRIVEQGRHSELIARKGLYAFLYNVQHDFARHEPLEEALETAL